MPFRRPLHLFIFFYILWRHFLLFVEVLFRRQSLFVHLLQAFLTETALVYKNLPVRKHDRPFNLRPFGTGQTPRNLVGVGRDRPLLVHCLFLHFLRLKDYFFRLRRSFLLVVFQLLMSYFFQHQRFPLDLSRRRQNLLELFCEGLPISLNF